MKKCWSCGKNEMCPSEDLGKGWFRCFGCGATWSKVPRRIAPIIILKPDRMQGQSYSPSGSAVVKREV